jgi:hypothetical protein
MKIAMVWLLQWLAGRAAGSLSGGGSGGTLFLIIQFKAWYIYPSGTFFCCFQYYVASKIRLIFF